MSLVNAWYNDFINPEITPPKSVKQERINLIVEKMLFNFSNWDEFKNWNSESNQYETEQLKLQKFLEYQFIGSTRNNVIEAIQDAISLNNQSPAQMKILEDNIKETMAFVFFKEQELDDEGL